jgi:hypothetical protein
MQALFSRLGWPLCFTLTACFGSVDGVQHGAGSSSSSSAGSASTGGTAGQSSVDCTQVSAPPLHARLLTPSQYDNTVQDLLRVGDHPAKEFGGGVAAKLDEVAVERRANAAARIAASAAATLAAWSPCLEMACQATLIEKLGVAAFRHPLSDVERAQLTALFEAGLKEKDFAMGVEWLVTGLLQTPDFLYQLSKPRADEVAGQIMALEPHELASRLAFFMWDSAPDSALLDSAAAGSLSTPDALRPVLTRLVADPRFERGLDSFYREWLGLEGFREVARDDAALTTELLGSLERSLLLSATSLYRSEAPHFTQLLSGELYPLNAELRAFYGLAGGTSELEPVALIGQGRHGILTHPGLMTLLARPSASDPIARGLFLQRTVLCRDIPPPPPGVTIPPLAPVAPGSSTRARLEQHTVQPLCKSCHDQIDPPGFALESYDAVGRFRTQDAGVAVDSSGDMKTGLDVDGPFASGGELLDRMAQSNDVKRCFAQHYLSHAVLRALEASDDCSLSRVSDDFARSGDLKGLVLSVALSDAFRLRASEGVAP